MKPDVNSSLLSPGKKRAKLEAAWPERFEFSKSDAETVKSITLVEWIPFDEIDDLAKLHLSYYSLVF